MGSREAHKVILYIHGGGFGLPPSTGHVKFMAQCRSRLAKAGKEVVVAFVEYGLTPESKHPTQYIQALESLRLVLDRGYQPANILLGGDSAGGNIVLAMMSHMLHPHKSLPHVPLATSLSGVFLISPWTSFSSDSSTYIENASKDIVFPQQMHDWADAFIAISERDEYCEPARASVEWWKGVPAKQVLVLCGNDEVFREHIQLVGARFEEAGVNSDTVTCAKQIHVDCILDEGAGLDPGDMSHALWDWLETVYA
ncbi:Alpha/Beta hydrolase protein [Leptodontidium sp. 2 PMI_412]|nr:Alpha/Beta hydrolase protein [Leptodontidium sp. 2 PMI_412]